VELTEKFRERKIAPDASDRYLADLITLGEHVIVAPEQMPDAIEADPDDNAILACAFVGRATHIVTYDPHFDVLGGAYQGIPILDGLHFLYIVRGDRPPENVPEKSAEGQADTLVLRDTPFHHLQTRERER
jgi:predicted nucleic acid-binding protein